MPNHTYTCVSSRLFFSFMEDCWIDPNGQIIEVGKFNHNDYARELLISEMGLTEMLKLKGRKSPYEVLHDRGWVRVKFNKAYLPRIQILGDCIDLTRQMRNTIDPAMNARQMRVAKMLCDENNTDFHIAINDKRFW